VHRDRVALIGFRGSGALLLMEPGRAVERARRALDCLPAGGATPLASGLHLALELARRSLRPVLLVILTDGRANASSSGEPVWEELARAGLALRECGVVSLVIDTNRGRLAAGETRRLAALLDARCVALPGMDGTAVYRSVAAMAGEMR
jgi:magnesium chelatase subunit D